jgi:hypothetical protein
MSLLPNVGSILLALGRLDYCVEVDIPRHKVKKERKHIFSYGETLESLNLDMHQGRWFETRDARRTAAAPASPACPAASAPPASTHAWFGLAAVARRAIDSIKASRQRRANGLAEQLEKFLKEKNISSSTFVARSAQDGNTACVHCRFCEVAVSDKYDGGYFFADRVEEIVLHFWLYVHVYTNVGHCWEAPGGLVVWPILIVCRAAKFVICEALLTSFAFIGYVCIAVAWIIGKAMET